MTSNRRKSKQAAQGDAPPPRPPTSMESMEAAATLLALDFPDPESPKGKAEHLSSGGAARGLRPSDGGTSDGSSSDNEGPFIGPLQGWAAAQNETAADAAGAKGGRAVKGQGKARWKSPATRARVLSDMQSINRSRNHWAKTPSARSRSSVEGRSARATSGTPAPERVGAGARPKTALDGSSQASNGSVLFVPSAHLKQETREMLRNVRNHNNTAPGVLCPGCFRDVSGEPARPKTSQSGRRHCVHAIYPDNHYQSWPRAVPGEGVGATFGPETEDENTERNRNPPPAGESKLHAIVRGTAGGTGAVPGKDLAALRDRKSVLNELQWRQLPPPTPSLAYQPLHRRAELTNEQLVHKLAGGPPGTHVGSRPSASQVFPTQEPDQPPLMRWSFAQSSWQLAADPARSGSVTARASGAVPSWADSQAARGSLTSRDGMSGGISVEGRRTRVQPPGPRPPTTPRVKFRLPTADIPSWCKGTIILSDVNSPTSAPGRHSDSARRNSRARPQMPTWPRPVLNG